MQDQRVASRGRLMFSHASRSVRTFVDLLDELLPALALQIAQRSSPSDSNAVHLRPVGRMFVLTA